MRGWLAADIGGTKLAVAAYDGKKLFARMERPTAGHRGAEAVLDDLTDMLRCCAEKAGLTEILGIGMSASVEPYAVQQSAPVAHARVTAFSRL